MNEINKKNAANAIAFMIEKFAEKKANANCLGFLYEPKKPEKLVRK